MKLKGVGFFEQNVEKLVLGAVSVVFLGVVAMQFLYEPNKIKVGSEAALPPGRAFDPVAKKASVIEGKITAPEDALNLPPVPKIDLVQDFKTRHSAPIAPSDRIAALGSGVEVTGADSPILTPTGTQRLATLEVPAPVSPVAVAYRNTIDPSEAVSYPELAKLLPAQQPMDKASVTVEASFDGTALRTALLATKSDGAAYPTNWWRDQIELLGVRLERQEQSSSGEWGPAQEVPMPPGRGIPDLVKNVRAPADMPDLLGTARGAADTLLRPEAYRVIAGTPWKPPSEVAPAPVGGAVKNDAVKTLLDQRARFIKEQAAQEKQLQAAQQQQPNRGGGGGGGGGKGGGGGGGGGAPPPDPDKKLKPIQDRLKRIEDNLAKNENELKTLGFDTEGNPLPVAVAAAPVAATPTAKQVLEDPKVRIWAHDYTVMPGKTYRYRLKVLLNNPVFGRAATLIPEQVELSKSPVMESAASEWSAPVAVLDDQYFFIASATEADAQGPARATVEMYKFFYGYYRPSGKVYFEPGDVLTSEVKLPAPEMLPIYDMKQVAAGGEQPGAAPPPAAPAGRSPAPQAPGGKGGQGGERQQTPAAQEQKKVELPANAEKWKGPVRVEFATYLLDVARVPGASGRSQTFLRGEDGTVMTRATAEEEKSEAQRFVQVSAKEGENQGQPLAPSTEKKPEGPQGPAQRAPEQAPPGKPGGGGGGGGG